MTDTSSAGAASGSSAPVADPSMEDILASIRRILNEDEQPHAAPAPGSAHAPEESDVFPLDASMIVGEPVDEHQAEAAEAVAPPAAPNLTLPAPPIGPVPPRPPLVEPVRLEPVRLEPARLAPTRIEAGLVAPEVAAAASSSVGSLLRTLEQRVATHHGGPTIEDIVRDEMRPLLKQWLDTHLPPMVERLVRAELERLVARVAT